MPDKIKMLRALEWDGLRDLTGWWISEKLAGVRGYWQGKERRFLSREGNAYNPPAWFTADLPDVDLDGELWLGRGKFDECSAICRRSLPRAGGIEWQKMTYVVFDVPDEKGPFEERMEIIERTVNGCRYAMAHKHVRAPDTESIRTMLQIVEDARGEGLVARAPRSRYVRGESYTCLKIKNFKDEEGVVVSHTRNPDGGFRSLRVKLRNDLVCTVGSGFTDRQRQSPPRVGTVVTVRYSELSPAGKPRSVSFIGARDYE